MRRPLYSTMKARFGISLVANRPSPVRERPIRNGLLRGIRRRIGRFARTEQPYAFGGNAKRRRLTLPLCATPIGYRTGAEHERPCGHNAAVPPHAPFPPCDGSDIVPQAVRRGRAA